MRQFIFSVSGTAEDSEGAGQTQIKARTQVEGFGKDIARALASMLNDNPDLRELVVEAFNMDMSSRVSSKKQDGQDVSVKVNVNSPDWIKELLSEFKKVKES